MFDWKDLSELLIAKTRFKTIGELFNQIDSFAIFAGPCSVEDYDQLEAIAMFMAQKHIPFFRAGAFKPRKSPYSFQGLGLEALKLLEDIRKKYGLLVVSEIMDPRDVEDGIKYTDIIQIGSRNMMNYSLLKEVGQSRHPILLKRGIMSTVEEFLLAAEYIISAGNEHIILCERGIRTFETATRNTLDIACVALIKQYTSLPIIVDVSHSLGRTDVMPPIIRSVRGVGADGIMIEVHNDPSKSRSDKYQQLSIREFEQLLPLIQ